MSLPLEPLPTQSSDSATCETPLLFAIPKKGRLYDKCVELLKGTGIDYVRPNRLDIANVSNLNVTLVFLPAADIAKYVAEGDVDLGITGQDIVAETELPVNEVMKLGFGKCTLALQAPVVRSLKTAEELAGTRVVTSFPNVTKKFFQQYSEKTHIQYVSGSVEAACGLGLADCIVDLVETGTTMRAAGLEIVHEILKTEAVLISNPKAMHATLRNKIVKRIEGYLAATRFQMIQYNIPRDLLPQAEMITPGFTAPTVQPLEDSTWVAVSAMVEKSKTSEKMDELQDLGAQAILILSIANCRV